MSHDPTPPPDTILADLLAEIYPKADALVRTGRQDAAAACSVVADYVRAEIDDCVLALVHGSAAAGRARPYSDIDALIVRPAFPAIRRRIVVHQGHYLDLLETGADQLDRLLARARVTGNDWIVRALALGEPVVDRWSQTARLRTAAAALLDSGPDQASRQDMDVLRASITAQVSDLCRCRAEQQMLAAGLGLFAPLTALLAKQLGAWSHRGKQVADYLDKVDPAMNERLRAAYADLLRNRPHTLALLARDILAPCGGWLMEGFSNASPLSSGEDRGPPPDARPHP